MTTKELRAYVYEQHRQGRSDTQIAESLGLNIETVAKMMDGDAVVKPIETKPVEIKQEPKSVKKEPIKPASGVPSTKADKKKDWLDT